VAETVKVNLDKALLSLKITSIVAGALIACAVVYGQIDERMDNTEKKMGIMEERMNGMKETVDKIYEIVNK
jgi:glycerol uptake facilitator-like aquaporin